MKKWTPEEDDALRESYPKIGKMACCELLGRSEGQVRWRAWFLKLRADKSSQHFYEWQDRAAKSKVGKKRPDQAAVMKSLHDRGAFVFSEERRARMSEAVKRRWADVGHPRGFLGRKHSEESKAAISKASAAFAKSISEEERGEIVRKAIATRVASGHKIGERGNVSWKGAWREIGGYRKYYRSSWEANYARYLQFLVERGEIKSWLHEPDTFWFDKIKRGCVSYLPDFKVTGNDGSVWYVEVKGWMDDRSKTKIARMAKYHPLVKLTIVDSKAYKILAKQVSGMIKGWE